MKLSYNSKEECVNITHISNYNLNIMVPEYLPIKARITVSNGAAGNDIFVLNSNICRSSSMNRNIWCCEYLRSIDMETVWKLLNDKIKAVRTHYSNIVLIVYNVIMQYLQKPSWLRLQQYKTMKKSICWQSGSVHQSQRSLNKKM